MLTDNSPFKFGGECVCLAVVLTTSALPPARRSDFEASTVAEQRRNFYFWGVLINGTCSITQSVKCDYFLETWRRKNEEFGWCCRFLLEWLSLANRVTLFTCLKCIRMNLQLQGNFNRFQAKLCIRNWKLWTFLVNVAARSDGLLELSCCPKWDADLSGTSL